MHVPEESSLAGFHRFIGEQLHSDGGASLSPERALVMWRDRQETIEAIREGLDDLEARRTKPVEQFRREFADRHRLGGE